MIRDVNVIRNEACIPQHKLLVDSICINACTPKSRIATLHRKIWKLRDPAVKAEYEQAVNEKYENQHVLESAEDAWNHLRTTLLECADKVCG